MAQLLWEDFILSAYKRMLIYVTMCVGELLLPLNKLTLLTKSSVICMSTNTELMTTIWLGAQTLPDKENRKYIFKITDQVKTQF